MLVSSSVFSFWDSAGEALHDSQLKEFSYLSLISSSPSPLLTLCLFKTLLPKSPLSSDWINFLKAAGDQHPKLRLFLLVGIATGGTEPDEGFATLFTDF